jgi:acetyl-CoA C-acetyltransferase
MNQAVIVDALRSPIGRAGKGSLVEVRPDDMAAHVVETLVARFPQLPLEDVADVICGVSGQSGEQAYNLGRIIGQLAGLPEGVPGTTVNRFCASSLQALRMAHQGIVAGEGDIFLAVGVESATRRSPSFTSDDLNPRMVDRSRPDFVSDMYVNMVQTAENVAARFGVTREDMDEYALRSQTLAVRSRDDGTFAREIVPIETPAGTVSVDDGPRDGTTLDKLASLQPLLGEHGSVTAGNACPINDGAAAALVTSADRATELGLPVRGRILGSHVTGIAPELMGVGPVEATRGLLKRLGMEIGDVDVVELNEAFASQVLASARELEINIDARLNVFGGAIALGHPYGMTGVRMVTTMLNALETRDGSLGLVTQCIGGGQGMAMLIERVA